MLTWVPTEQVAEALTGLPGVIIEVVNPDAGAPLPASAADVEFYVPPFFPRPPSIAAMRQMPRLRVIQTLTAGIDLLRPHVPDGAVLCNARGAHDAGTAEWVVAAILASIRRFPYFAAEQAAARWSFRFTGCLAGKTVLIVGYGSIGAAVERRLTGFDVEIRRVARRARDGVHPIADLPALLPDADVVVLLAPVTAETIGMVDAGFLAGMKDGALFVNAARGSLAVTDDLREELRTGRLNAVLDVTDPEPLGPGDPLWAMPNVVITPHVAGSTPVSAHAALDFVRAQLQRSCSGQPLLNVITGEY
ncbi:MAG: 2-hydroxyacid dehydrogenase [Streptosporangiaceae bacterium]